MTYNNLKLFSIVLTITGLLFCYSGCSDDEVDVDLTGYWTGRTENFESNKSWNIKMYFYQIGNQLSGVYTDYRGNISIFDTSYVGRDLEFNIQLETGYVTFTGTRNTDNRLDGNWIYSENVNEGVWLLLRDDDNFSEGEEEVPSDDESDSTATGNPFA